MFPEPKYCTYITHYSGDLMPPFYIGSTSVERIKNGYHGSVASKTYKKIWLSELKNHPELFYTTIIRRYHSRKYALLKERRLQRNEYTDVVRSNKYINMSIANHRGFCGMDTKGKNNPRFGYKWTIEEKRTHSKIAKEVGQRPEIKSARSKLQKVLQNKPEMSEKKRVGQKLAWSNPNNNLQNSRASQFKKTPINFKDFSFISQKDYKLWLKENSAYCIKKYLDISKIAIDEYLIVLSNLNIIPRKQKDDISILDYPIINTLYNNKHYSEIYIRFKTKWHEMIRCIKRFKSNELIFLDIKIISILEEIRIKRKNK